MSTPIWLTNLIKPATGTDVAGKRSLDVFVSGGSLGFTEEATAADGGALPALQKVIAGYDGAAVQVIKTDAAGELQVDVLSSALPAGAATEATLSAINVKTPASTVSAGNSTITPLAGAGTFTGTSEDITPYIATSILMVTDQNGTLIPEYSNNGINWDETETYPIIVTTPGVSQSFAFSFMAEAQYFRVKYTNGATPQGNFKVQTVLNVNAPTGEIHPISSVLSSRMEALVTKGVIYGQTTAGGGTFVAVKVNPSGALSADVTGTVTTNEAGFTKANTPARNVYSSVNVTTAAYVQLVASTTSATKEIEIFDSSGQTMMLATGAAAAEVDQLLIFPGGNGRTKFAVPAATRISIKAVSATASVGEICINFWG